MKNTRSTAGAALLAGAFFAAASPAFAQLPSPAERVLVFGERLPMLRDDGVQAIAVIRREDIDARRPDSVPALLREVAGLHVDRLGNPAGLANVYIRGAEPNHTVVLVDGVRVNDPTDVRGGSYDLSSIALDEVERIEILRGASSAQFGADAMGGVINIVTRRARAGAAATFVAGAGGDGYRQGGARASAAGTRARVAGGVSRLEDGRERDGGTLRLDAADLSLDFDAPPGTSGRAFVRRGEREARAFPESSGGVRLAQNRALERRDVDETLAGASLAHQASSRWRLTLHGGSFERRELRETPVVPPGPGGFVPAATSSTRYERGTLLLQAAAGDLPFGSTLLFGLEGQREDGRRESVLRLEQDVPGEFRLVRETRSFYAQAQAEAAALRALVAARHDDVDPGGGETSRSAGLRYALPAGHALRASWSEGFKPPSFFALADPLVGSAGLRPERSRSREAGWEWRGERLAVQATGFDSRLADLVDFDPATFRMVNRAGARMRGAEGQVRVQLPSATRIGAAYTYLDAKLEESHARLRNRPRHRATLALEQPWGAWTARAAAVHVGETFDFSVPTGDVALPAYTTADVSLAWRARPLSLVVNVDNAFDRRFESFAGFATPGRRLRVTLSLAL